MSERSPFKPIRSLTGRVRRRTFATPGTSLEVERSGDRVSMVDSAVYLAGDRVDSPMSLADTVRSLREHEGSGLLAMADLYTSRGKNGYTDNSLDALYNVNCLDNGQSIPTSEVSKYLPRFEKASPMFGDQFAYSLSTCHAWPIHSSKRPHALHAKGSPPILVMGTTRDPATPLAWAEALAKQLDNGVLVVRDGDGHTGYNQGNTCADEAVEDFLVSDKVPANGTRC